MAAMNQAYNRLEEPRELPATRQTSSYTSSRGDNWLNTGSASDAYKNPDKALTSMYRQQLNDYNRYQTPVVYALDKEANGTELIDQAKVNASKLEGRVKSMTTRQLGMTSNTLLPSQRRAMTRNQDRKIALGGGALVTQATAAQKEKRVAARQQMMSIAEQLQQNGAASTAQVASNKAQRDAAAEQANKGMMSSVLSVAGAVVGGIYGGPAGAQMGAAAGGAIGGAVG